MSQGESTSSWVIMEDESMGRTWIWKLGAAKASSSLSVINCSRAVVQVASVLPC